MVAPQLATSSPDLQWVRPPQQDRSRRTLERLLEAAEELVIERGFDRTSVAAIARRAGSSVGAFYSRFRDKDALLHGLLDRFIEQSVATMDYVLLPAQWRRTSDRDMVRAQIDFCLRVFAERRLLLAALSRFTAGGERSSFREELAERLADRLAHLLEARGSRVGRPEPHQALQLVSWLILSAIESAVLQGSEGPRGMSRERTVAEIADLALAYLAIEQIQGGE